MSIRELAAKKQRTASEVEGVPFYLKVSKVAPKPGEPSEHEEYCQILDLDPDAVSNSYAAVALLKEAGLEDILPTKGARTETGEPKTDVVIGIRIPDEEKAIARINEVCGLTGENAIQVGARGYGADAFRAVLQHVAKKKGLA